MITVKSKRPSDVHEIIRRSPISHIPDADKTLRECMYRSTDVRCGMVDGVIACMCGLIPPTLLSDKAYLWLLTTDIVAEHKFLFVRHSQRYVEEALKEFPIIVGNCAINNHSAIRWLRWLGAEFDTEIVNGHFGFVIRKK